MCKKRPGRLVELLNGKKTRLDTCMKNLIMLLNDLGVETLGCCCGHGRYDMSIVVKDEVGRYDLVSGVRIPRVRRFYVTDVDGFYYIPEVKK